MKTLIFYKPDFYPPTLLGTVTKEGFTITKAFEVLWDRMDKRSIYLTVINK